MNAKNTPQGVTIRREFTASNGAANPIVYDLAVSGTTLPINGGSTIQTADNIGALGTMAVTQNGFVGSSVAPAEVYQFTLSAASTVVATLSGIGLNAGPQLRLLNVSGQTVQYANASANSNGSLIYNLAAGTYFLDVAGDGTFSTNYTLTAQATPIADNGGTSISSASVLGSVGQASSYSIAATSANQADSTSGTTPYTFTVTRTGDTSQASNINYAVAGAAPNAAPSSQFQNTAGYVTFAAGATTATITVNVLGANISTAEGFTVTISPGNNVNTTQIGTATAVGTIGANATVSQPALVNNSDGTSYLYTYNPTSTVAETIATYNGANATGTMISDIVDNGDGTSLIYAYNPSSTVTQTTQQWSATNAANGAPSGSQISEVVDNTDGTSLVYAYNPSSTVTQTTQEWSATNAANGAPAGSEISDVVDNTNGTALLYSYNPTSTVTQTTSEYSATNSANGAPTGTELSDVVDNTDGTSILYAYNPTGSIMQTATYYRSYDASTGAPAGTVTSETADYTNGASAITTDASDGTSSTTYYGGADGTGSVIGGPVAGAFDATPPTPGTPDTVTADAASTAATASQAGVVPDNAVITLAGLNQFIDLGTGNHTIQFISGGAPDTLLLPAAGTDQLLGFNPAAGDTLDLSALFAAAGVGSGNAISQLSSYVSVVNLNGSAAVLFDPAGHGGGSQVALLVNDGALVPQLQTLKAFSV